MAGMGPENVAEFTAAGLGEAALTAFLEEAAAGLGQVTGHQVAQEMGGLISAADRAGETETEVAAMTQVARVADPGLPVAEVLGYDLAEQTGHALVLTGQRPGSSVIPRAFFLILCGA